MRYAAYESNEEMLARVMSGNSGWDVVFPTHYLLSRWRETGLLAPLDHRRLPSLGNLDAVSEALPGTRGYSGAFRICGTLRALLITRS